jgi:hypothetical protein
MLVLFSAADGRDSRLRFRQPFEPMTPGIVSLAEVSWMRADNRDQETSLTL